LITLSTSPCQLIHILRQINPVHVTCSFLLALLQEAVWGEWRYRSEFSWPRHQVVASASFTPLLLYAREEREPSTHYIGGWVDPTAGPDDMDKWKFSTLPGPEPRLLGLPARSQLLTAAHTQYSICLLLHCITDIFLAYVFVIWGTVSGGRQIRHT
jgi:hypothetical protein